MFVNRKQWATAGLILLSKLIFVTSSPTGLSHETVELSSPLPSNISVEGNSSLRLMEDQILSNSTTDSLDSVVLIDNITFLTNLTEISELNKTHILLLLNSTSPTVSCDTKEVDNIAENIKNMCIWVGDIDAYVNKVFSRDLMTVPSVSDTRGYKQVITQYNDHVETSKDHCYPWRNGDSIVAAFQNVVAVAQGFQPHFTSAFEDTLKLVHHISKNHENMAENEDKITKLQGDIEEAREVIELEDSKRVVAHLEDLVKRTEKEIQNITSENQLNEARRELEVLINYLENVRNYSLQLEMEAEDVLIRMSNFRDNTLSDSGALKRHRSAALQGMESISQDIESNNQQLANIQTEMQNLHTKIAEARTRTDQTNAQIQTAQRELAELEHSISRSLKTVKRRKKWGRIFRVAVPVVGWVAGSKMVDSAKDAERRLADQKRAYINSHTQVVQSLHTVIENSHRDIAHHQSRITDLTRRTGELEEELHSFRHLNSYLQDIEEEADSVLPFMAKAITSMGQMRENYDSVKYQLQTVIEVAKEAKSEAEAKNVKYFIYNEIESLKCRWEDAQAKIVMPNQCH